MLGSFKFTVVEFTVVVVPLTVRSPVIVTSLGSPIVTVPAFSATVVSFAVPTKVRVPPKATGEVLEPSETVIELFANSALATPASLIVTAPLETGKLS